MRMLNSSVASTLATAAILALTSNSVLAQQHDAKWMRACKDAYSNDQRIARINNDEPIEVLAKDCPRLREIISLKQRSIRDIEGTSDHCAEDNVLQSIVGSIERAKAHYGEVCH